MLVFTDTPQPATAFGRTSDRRLGAARQDSRHLMTTDSRTPDSDVTGTAHPSTHVVRARKLLLGGLSGGLAATVICLAVFFLIHGVRGMLSSAGAAAIVLLFYAIGQYVMVRSADAGARTLMTVSMASYTVRAIVLGLVLLVYEDNRDAWTALVPIAVFATIIAVVVGWLVVEIFVFSRLRIGVYDTEYVAPEGEHAQ